MSKATRSSRAAAAGSTRRRWLFGLLLVAGLGLLGWQQRRLTSSGRTPDQPAATASRGESASPDTRPATTAAVPGVGIVQTGQPGEPAAGDSAAARAERLRLAEERLATYRRFAQYPPGSRPARENADQLYPLAPVVRGIPLSLGGRASEHILLKLRQSRLWVVGSESIELGIRCEDSQAQILPCAVENATLQVLPGPTAPARPLPPVEFGPDAQPGRQGELVAALRPATLRLAEAGRAPAASLPLRVEVTLTAGRDPRERGTAIFDFLYTADPPAVSEGPLREAIVQGSLVLRYPLAVKRPGRYLLHARLDDATGRPVAYLEFNDVLPAGPQEVALVAFGKLLLDEKPRFPLQVRDFDGFLLREDAEPDREHIPPRAGVHHTTQVYPPSAFSAAEWQSEERTRHEREYEKDVQQARP